MKKRNVILMMVFIVLLALSGCGDKTAIATSDFTSVAESHSFITSDASSQYSSYEYIKEATIAQSPDGWQMEFYVLDNEANAVSMFNTNREIFEGYKGNSSGETSSSTGNQSSYSLSSSGLYMHLCRVDNTLLYVKVDADYKDDAKELIEELGY